MGKIDLKKLLFTWEGRLNRQPFLILILASVIICGLLETLFGEKSLINISINVIDGLILLCPTIKRLHDRNYSGWMILLPLALLIGGGLMGGLVAIVTGDLREEYANVLMLGAIGAMLWLWVETWFLRGTEGPNAYGPDPLDSSES